MDREEAINVVKRNWPEGRHQLSEALKTLIPEFQESEDEKIRNRIIGYLKLDIEERPEREERINEMLAYLEKQKDEAQKQFNLGIQAGKEEVLYEMEKEQKPAEWSEEDEAMLKEIISFLKDGSVKLQHDLYLYAGFLENRFKSLRPQPKQEWSEEDEAVLDALIRRLEGEDIYVSPHLVVKCLKALRNRPKSSDTWKPSEEQMRYLLAVINEPNNAGAESCHIALQSLYSGLKNL